MNNFHDPDHHRFQHEYAEGHTNDSPVDLSGREGAPKMNDEEICQDISTVIESLNPDDLDSRIVADYAANVTARVALEAENKRLREALQAFIQYVDVSTIRPGKRNAARWVELLTKGRAALSKNEVDQ